MSLEKTVTEMWVKWALKNTNLSLSAIDALVAGHFSVSVRTVQSYRRQELPNFTHLVSPADLKNWTTGCGTRKRRIPGDHWEAFRSLVVDSGLTPTQAYGALARTAAAQGVGVASQASFLRRWAEI